VPLDSVHTEAARRTADNLGRAEFTRQIWCQASSEAWYTTPTGTISALAKYLNRLFLTLYETDL